MIGSGAAVAATAGTASALTRLAPQSSLYRPTPFASSILAMNSRQWDAVVHKSTATNLRHYKTGFPIRVLNDPQFLAFAESINCGGTMSIRFTIRRCLSVRVAGRLQWNTVWSRPTACQAAVPITNTPILQKSRTCKPMLRGTSYHISVERLWVRCDVGRLGKSYLPFQNADISEFQNSQCLDEPLQR